MRINANHQPLAKVMIRGSELNRIERLFRYLKEREGNGIPQQAKRSCKGINNEPQPL
jgi:hypothetical protein